MKTIVILLVILMGLSVNAQNLSKQRIWKITSDKRSIYFDQGIFHSDKKRSPAKLTNIRNSYVTSRGYERVVLDFDGSQPPKIYGHISMSKNKMYLDLFNTTLSSNIANIKNVKFLENVDFFNIDKDLLSIEFKVSNKVSYDIFYLENPGRIVIDIKK